MFDLTVNLLPHPENGQIQAVERAVSTTFRQRTKLVYARLLPVCELS